MIVIIDYGMSNLRSIKYKLSRHKVDSIISSDNNEIYSADKLILPGVGHFKKGMDNLEERDLVSLIKEKVTSLNTPIFGICLGMQLFSQHSEEGDCNGLGLIDANVIKFTYQKKENFKVPHVGWNTAKFIKDSPILSGIAKSQEFYFTHSYHIECGDDIAFSKTDYGYEFVSAVCKDNIVGTQFHPEKSHLEGFNLLLNFCRS